jgi:hypothetical protein
MGDTLALQYRRWNERSRRFGDRKRITQRGAGGRVGPMSKGFLSNDWCRKSKIINEKEKRNEKKRRSSA